MEQVTMYAIRSSDGHWWKKGQGWRDNLNNGTMYASLGVARCAFTHILEGNERYKPCIVPVECKTREPMREEVDRVAKAKRTKALRGVMAEEERIRQALILGAHKLAKLRRSRGAS